MSTKTSIKRIAAVAAVALTLGGFSAVSANATAAADTLAVASTAVTATAGTASTVAVTSTWIATAGTNDKVRVIAALISAPSGSVSLPTFDTATVSGYTNTNVSYAGNGTSTVTLSPAAWTAAVYNSGTFKLSLNPDSSGTYVVKLLPYVTTDGSTYVAGNAASATVTFTVADKPAITAAASSVLISGGTSSAVPATPTTTTDAVAVLAPKAGYAGNYPVARIDTIARNSATADTADAAKISVTVTGPGLVSFANDGSGRGRAITDATANNTKTVYVFADGTSGAGTITISSGTTVLATKTVTFYGSAASYTPTVVNSVVTTDAAAAAVTTTGSEAPATPAYHAIKVLVADAAGNPVSGATVYANSSDKTVIAADYLASAASDSKGYAYFDIVGVAAGTANISFTNRSSAADTATEIKGAPVAIRVGSGTADSATVTFDSSTYNPGGSAVVTVTVHDSKGLPVADGVYSVFAAATTSSLALLQGTLPGTAADGVVTSSVFVSPKLTAGQVWVKGSEGKATFTVNMPLAAGDVTISALGASGLGTAQAGVKIAGTATVGADAAVQAATDAAQEATDAANAAYDAANNAMDSADAATAAAQDAADNASAALAAVTSLSATVAKLVKSVASIAAALAKIQKKIGA